MNNADKININNNFDAPIVRMDTTANWTINNPVLERGELAVEIATTDEGTTYALKVGDGVKGFLDLPYVGGSVSTEGSAAVLTYASLAAFPNIGSVKALYIALDENALYRFNESDNIYYCVGRDYTEITVISGGGA